MDCMENHDDFRHCFVTILPWEAYSGIFSYEEPYGSCYEEAYGWYTDYGRTGNAVTANDPYELYGGGSSVAVSFQQKFQEWNYWIIQ